MNFNQALQTGKVVVRRTWVNQGSTKDQISVQFMQQIPVERTGTSNTLVAIAQGITGAGFNKVTTIMSFKRDVIEPLLNKAGVKNCTLDFSETSNAIFASDVFNGTEVNIQVLENTEKNPQAVTQQPKVNPQTGEVQMYNGNPIYRHTTLVEGTAKHTFLAANQSNSVRSVSQPSASEVLKSGVPSEIF